MFDFSDENKEKYYLRAEEYMQVNGMTGFEIDRERFAALNKDHQVKIYFVPFYPKRVTRKELMHAKKLDKVVITNDRYTPRKKGDAASMRENGYILLEMDEEDW